MNRFLIGFLFMKKWLSTLIPGLLLICFTGASAYGQGRNATIDLRKVFDNYWKTKQADAALKDRAADMEKEYNNMVQDYTKAKAEYQNLLSDANNQALSQEEREKRKKSAEDKLKLLKDTEDSIKQYRTQATTTIDEQRRRMRDNIVAEIRNVLNAKAKSAGYSMVLDTTAEGATLTPVVLYTSNENDMTEALLNQLNAGAPAEGPRPKRRRTRRKRTERSSIGPGRFP